ncbi:hypothetical protein HYU07_05980 [Candidatus Woesearchaeota archaeon]|nr:hypothetical protein [Candidatus Woesearchaeota archaeon]
MFGALKRYFKSNPVCATLTTIASSSALLISLDHLLASHQMGVRPNNGVLKYASLTVICATASLVSNHLRYRIVAKSIEKEGFTYEILSKKWSRKFAKIYAEEQDRFDEYRCSLQTSGPWWTDGGVLY